MSFGDADIEAPFWEGFHERVEARAKRHCGCDDCEEGIPFSHVEEVFPKDLGKRRFFGVEDKTDDRNYKRADICRADGWDRPG